MRQSIQAGLIVDRHRILTELYARIETGWHIQACSQEEDVDPLEALACHLPLRDIFQRSQFGETQPLTRAEESRQKEGGLSNRPLFNSVSAPFAWRRRDQTPRDLLSFQQRDLAQRLQLLLDDAGVTNHDDDEVVGLDVGVRDIEDILFGHVFDVTSHL